MLDQLEITIQNQTASGWPVVIELSAVNRLPQRTSSLIALAQDPQMTLRGIADPRRYGIALGEMVFNNPRARQLFADALNLPTDHVHVLLVVEDAGLQTLQWELLAGPDGAGSWVDLARHQRTPFSRYLPGVSRRHYPPIGSRDQRALVVWANPPVGSSYDRFDTAAGEGEDSFRQLLAALSPVETDVIGVDVPDALGPPTLAQLALQLTRRKYTLLHIVAHGTFSSQAKEPVIMLRADEAPERIKGYPAAKVLDQLRNVTHLPYLIFLTACRSAQRDVANPFGDLANVLMTELGIPAVIAMTDTVSIATANALAHAFYPLLLTERFVDVALTQARAGIARFDIAVPALYSRLGHRALFADSVERPLTAAEWAFGVEQALPLFAERAPDLVFELQAAGDELANTALVAPDLRDDGDRARETAARQTIEKLVHDVLEMPLAALALDRPVRPYDARCPFPGSRAFTEAEAPFFFGRTEEIGRLLEWTEQKSLVALVGPASCGKSSLLQAGLVPALRQRQPEATVRLVSLSDNPDVELNDALSGNLPDYLIIDQFERLLTTAFAPDDAAPVLERLLALPVGHQVILLLRSDGAVVLDRYPKLADAIAAGRTDLAPLAEAALRDVSERQAGAVGLQFEAGLAHTIVDAVKGEAGAMPVLQQALARLWQKRRGRWLTAVAYHETGGVLGAAVAMAEALVAAVPPAVLASVGDLCLRLVQPQPARPGLRSAAVARPTQLADLADSESQAAAVGLLETLFAGRLLVLSPTLTIELAHTGLLPAWARLIEWLNADPVFVRARNEINDVARRWAAETGSAGDYLLRGQPLADAESLLIRAPTRFTAQEKAFVRASTIAVAAAAARRRAAARNRAAVIGFVASALTYGPAAIVLWSGIVEDDLGLLLYFAVNQALYGGAFGLLFTLLLDPALLRQWPRADWQSWARVALTGMVPLALLKFLERLVISGNLLDDVAPLLGALVTGAVWGGVTAIAAFWLVARRSGWLTLAAAALLAGFVHAAGLTLLQVMRVEPALWRLVVSGLALPFGLLLANRINTPE